MDLDHMKKTWNEIDELRSQETLLDEASIRRITHEKSSSRLRLIMVSECIGVLMALAMIGYLAIHFHKLDNWFTLISGYGTLTVLLISVAMGSRIISQAYQVNIKEKTYSATLAAFSRLKKSLGFYKRMSIGVSFLLPVLIIPVFYKLWLGKNILEDLAAFRNVILLSFILVPIMLYGIFYLYKQNVRKISKALKEAEDEIS